MIVLLGAAAARSARAQSGRAWRPEERVLITSFAEVGALARDRLRLYAATRGGLVVYDPLSRTFDLPLTAEDGYPILELPSALAVDPLGDELWLGTAQGSLYRLRAIPARWENVAFALGGPVLAIVPTHSIRDDAIYVQTASGWHRTRRVALGARPVSPAEVPAGVITRARALTALDPALTAFRATLGLDARSRRWPLTASIPGETPETYWFATRGAFVFHFDARRGTPDWLWFGAPARGATAVAVSGETVMIGGDGRGPRDGLVHFSSDLQHWTLHDPLEGGPRGPIAQIAARGGDWYVATRDGVFHRTQGAWERLGFEDATSVAPDAATLWVGTRRGLAVSGRTAVTILTGVHVNRVRVHDDTAWVATRTGVFQVPPPTDSARGYEAEAVAVLPGSAFVDVVPVGQTILAIAPDAVWTRSEGQWRGPLRTPVLSGVGRLIAAAADGDAVWIAAERGAVRYVPATGEWSSLLAPADLPQGPVYDLAPAGRHVWLATPVGALRVQWRR